MYEKNRKIVKRKKKNANVQEDFLMQYYATLGDITGSLYNDQ